MLQTNLNDQALRDTLDAIEFLALNQLKSDPTLAQGTTTTQFKNAAFGFMLGGQVYAKAAVDGTAPGAGANTTGAQYRKTLIAINASGTISMVHGDTAATQAAAVIPDPVADTLPIGYLEIPVSFTSGTTDVTSGMIKRWVHSIDVTYT